MAEFWPKGRVRFFDPNPWAFWLTGRGGIFPDHFLTPVTLGFGLLLPFLWCYRKQFSILNVLQADIVILSQILLASLGLFLVAHVVLFKLQLPSRYTQHSFRILIAFAAAIALTAIIEKLWSWSGQIDLGCGHRVLALGLSGVLIITLLFYPAFLKRFPVSKYKVGKAPALYEFLAQQPPDTLVASLSNEADNIPAFSLRSVLIGQEYALPYHVGYYRQFQERAIALIQAQYSLDLRMVKTFIRRYNIDFWVLDQEAFTENYFDKRVWLKAYQPATDLAIQTLHDGLQPAIAQLEGQCTMLKANDLLVLDANCLLQASPE
jgi:hypothetical protein